MCGLARDRVQGNGAHLWAPELLGVQRLWIHRNNQITIVSYLFRWRRTEMERPFDAISIAGGTKVRQLLRKEVVGGWDRYAAIKEIETGLLLRRESSTTLSCISQVGAGEGIRRTDVPPIALCGKCFWFVSNSTWHPIHPFRFWIHLGRLSFSVK